MNVLLWIIQGLLALHTLIGAVWKFMNSAQVLPFENSIPPIAWMILGVIEIICAGLLIAPLIKKSLGKWVPFAALVVAAEMMVFSILLVNAGHPDKGPLIYWLVTAGICVALAAGRRFVRPL